jgi:DNA polymerase-3 subunit delta
MIIFLYGADTFRSHEKLASLKNKYLEKNSSGTDPGVLDYGEQASVQQMKDSLAAQGLFSSKRLIIVKNAISENNPDAQKEILALLKLQAELENDTDTVLIFFESGNPKKNGALFKYLLAHAKKQEFAPLDGVKLSQWALAHTKTLNPDISFSTQALNMLISFVGNDLYLLSNEISKLVNFKNAGDIAPGDVELLVKSKIDSTMFEAIEALASGNKKRALALMHQQIEKGEDPHYILSMYTYQIRTLLKIADFYYQGLQSAPQIAQASGLHPYVVQKSLSQVRNLSEAKLKQIFSQLAEIDLQAKTGKTDLVLALDSFIVSL